MRTFLEQFPVTNEDARSSSLDRNLIRLQNTPRQYAVAQNYTFKDNDTIDSLQVNATSGNLIVTLPSPTGNRRRRIIKTDASANTVTVVVSTSGQLINTASSWVLSIRYDYIEVEPTGTGWIVVNGALGSVVGPGAFTTLSATGLITATGGQIAFPATQIPSADANTLDDYEEGTWTPSVGGNATYTYQEGKYTKIGRLVFVHCHLTLNVIGTGSTTTISGLPFAPGVVSGGTVSYWGATNGTYIFLSCFTSGSTLLFSGATAATATLSTSVAILQNATEVILSIIYSV